MENQLQRKRLKRKTRKYHIKKQVKLFFKGKSAKRIWTTIALCLAFLLGIFLFVENRKSMQVSQELLSLEEQLRPLNVKKQNLARELKELDRNYEAIRRPKATAQLLFTEADSRVYEVCYPLMKEQKLTGVLALSENSFPGMEKCMTEQQFKELLDEGWSICARFNSSARLTSQWDSLKKKLESIDVEQPTTAYFANTIYNTNLDSTLTKCGFSIVVHHGEQKLSVVQPKDENGIWHIGSVGLKGQNPKILFFDALEKQANLVTLINFTSEDELYTEKPFNDFISTCSQRVALEELLVVSPEDARAHFQNRIEEANPEAKQEYLTKKQELQTELEKVQKEIEELQK